MGRRSDDRPPIEVVDGVEDQSNPTRVEVRHRRPSRGKALAGLAAVVVLLVGGLVLGDDDDSGDAPAERTRPSAPRAQEGSGGSDGSADATGEAPTTSLLAESPAPVLGTPVGAGLLLGSRNGPWRYLDLDTGRIADVEQLEGTEPQLMQSVEGGVAVLGDPFRAPDIVPLPEGEPSSQRADLGLAVRTVPVRFVESGLPDQLWRIVEEIDSGNNTLRRWAALVGLTGKVTVPAFEVEGGAYRGTAYGLVSSVGGRTYLHGPDGVRPLSDGVAHATTADEVAVLVCDDLAACRAEIVDVESGRARPGPRLPGAADGRFWMSLSADGELATIPARVGSRVGSALGAGLPSAVLTITSPDGRARSVELLDLRSEPVWLPDGLGMVAITGYGVMHVFETGGELAIEPIDGLRPELDNAVLVIPQP